VKAVECSLPILEFGVIYKMQFQHRPPDGRLILACPNKLCNGSFSDFEPRPGKFCFTSKQTSHMSVWCPKKRKCR
jgi:hypothetical protein